MSICRSRRPERLVAALLLATMQTAAAAPWFGAACADAPAPALSAGAMPRQQWVRVRRSPLDPGHDITLLVTRDGRYWVGPDDLVAWQLPRPNTAYIADGVDWYPLDGVRGLAYRLDACTQELWLDTAEVSGVRHRFNIGLSEAEAAAARMEPGGHLNLDLQYLEAPQQRQLSGTAEAGVFAAAGHGLASVLYDGERAVRLETRWTRDWPDRAERLTAGDSIARSGTFGQALRFGGLQWGTEFSLQPDRVTFPLPELGGRAALPSTVDVYVNQVLRAQQDVPPGRFELSNVPVVTGAGEVQLVVRDLLGRSQIIVYPFYVAPTLLRAGLHEYGVQAGALREAYGYEPDRYGPGFVSGRLRSGFDDRLTGAVYVEAAERQQMAGTDVTGLMAPYGTWNFGFAGSHTAQANGLSVSLGAEHNGPRWSAALQARAGTSGFAQLGEVDGSLRSQWLGRLGFPVHADGMLSLSYLRDDRRDREGSSILGAGYGTRLGRDWYVGASLTQLYGSNGGLGAALTLTHAFSTRATAVAQVDRAPGADSTYRVALQGDPPAALGLGYRVMAEQGLRSRGSGGLRWGGERGTATIEAESLDGDNSLRLGLASGLAILGRDVFWTRPVDSSFAVVDAGAPDTRVYRDNYLVGRTDEDGRLLISGLRPYERNSLRIEDADLPLRYGAQSLTVSVVPPVQTGLRARFAVEDVPSASLRLRLPDGAPVPLGARLLLDGRMLELPVGFDGQALIEAASGDYRLEARWATGHCNAVLNIAADATADEPPQSLVCTP